MGSPPRILPLLFLLAFAVGEPNRGHYQTGHRVVNSQDFYNAVQNRSNAVVYLDSDVEVRNYYGWVFSKKPKNRHGRLQLAANPLRYVNEAEPKIDVDDLSLHRLLAGRSELHAEGLHFLNVDLLDRPALMNVGKSEIVLESCIVEVYVKAPLRTIRAGVRYLRSLMQDPSGLPYSAAERLTDWYCARNLGVSCPSGAVLFYNHTLPWTEDYAWRLIHSVVVFVPRKNATVAVSDVFLTAIEDEADHIAIPYSLELNFRVCKRQKILRNTTIYAPNRSLPPSLVMNFQERLYGCISVAGRPILKVKDLILRNIFHADAWPVMFPFVDAPSETTVVLENVIIEMDTDLKLSNHTLKQKAQEIRRRSRPDGLGQGPQNLSVWQPEDCTAQLLQQPNCKNQGKCPGEAKCPHGAIFVEDVAYLITENDGNRDLGVGVRYRIRHSLITVIPPPPVDLNGSAQTGVKEFARQRQEEPVAVTPVKEATTPRETLLLIATVIIGILCASLAICGYTSYKCGAFEKWSGGKEKLPDVGQLELGLKLGQGPAPTHLTPEIPTDALAAKRIDMHQAYQQTANRLLGSVTLGPLLGSGSFGKVFKATWNGAPVAVKVIVHDGQSYRGTSAEREAALSTQLHHPNIIQTFVQTTREIKHDQQISSVSQPPPNTSSQSGTASTAVTSDDAGGYMNLAELVPNEYRPEPPPRSLNESVDWSSSRGRSFSGDCVETWLVQEYCDMGSLDKAIRKGKFMKGEKLDMVLVVETCLDICRGMHYLKNCDVIHGDLKSCNILLNGSYHEEKRFVAKVADFGMSRQLLGHASHISTQTTGTVTHMPPEIFREERLTAASDVYSFGIVMWELVSKESPLEGVPHFLIIKKIVYERWRPTFLDGVPDCYAALARRCWAEESHQRPTIEQALEELESMREYFLQSEQ